MNHEVARVVLVSLARQMADLFPVPYTRAKPWQVYDEMRADGGDHWGRRLVFADWLAGTFGEKAGRTLWLQIGEPNPPAEKHEMESSV